MKRKTNQKGFTMVELLGVIVIMGILTTIAVPAVTKYITKAQKASEETMLKSVYEATKDYMMKEDVIIKKDDSIDIKVNSLVDKQYVETLFDPKDKNKKCTNDNSVVTVKRTSEAKDIPIYEYKVKVICPSGTYQKTFS